MSDMNERTTLPTATGLLKGKIPAPPPRPTPTPPSTPTPTPAATPTRTDPATRPDPDPTADPSPTPGPGPGLDPVEVGTVQPVPVEVDPVGTGRAAERPTASSRSTGGSRETSISLPADIREQWRRAAAEPDTTAAEVILEAIEANLDQLEDLVARERGDVARQEPGLFPDRASVRSDGPTRVIAPLNTTARNLAVIDALVEKTRADSRSQLITAALRAVFQGEL